MTLVDAVLEKAVAWKKAGDTMQRFRGNPALDHVLSQADRTRIMAEFQRAVTDLHAAVGEYERAGPIATPQEGA